MIHKTKGIVLKSVKYGETSLVVTMFTELFGIQTYMVNGVRTTKKSSSKAAMFQSAALLDMEVYHSEQKSMHRIKECNWSFLYQSVLSEVVKNGIALFMVELLQKTLREPEQNADLFYFCEDALQQLDESSAAIAANFPLFFSLHLPQFYGFRMSNIEDSLMQQEDVFLDLQEGIFTNHPPNHPHYMGREDALITAELLKIMQPHELSEIKLNQGQRRILTLRYMDYYSLHLSDFGVLKTLQVLHEVLG